MFVISYFRHIYVAISQSKKNLKGKTNTYLNEKRRRRKTRTKKLIFRLNFNELFF